jgi:signal transduction histidine kinase
MHPEKPTLLVVVQGGEPKLHAMIREAARRAFPAAEVDVEIRPAGLPVPPTTSPTGLLVLVNPEVAEASPGSGPAGPVPGGCPVLRLGVESRLEDPEVVPLEGLNAPLLAHFVRSAVARHALLRENARARGDLLTVGHRITHDLRTPLGGIFASVEVLKEVLAAEEPAPAELIQPIADSGHDLANLIERVGFLIRASVNPLPRTPVPMAEPVLTALEKLQRQIRAQRASIVQPAAWPTLEAVAPWLEVVWWNLLANALQHAGPSPQISLGWDQAATGCRCWIRDQGPGVPPERRGKLFQPFHGLHELGSARGLGLSIVQRLVELQGGSCRYEASPEGGAVFSFTLPGHGVM